MSQKKLKFQKMWEALVSVFDIDSGSIQPMLVSLPRIAGFSDKEWVFYAKDGSAGGAYYEESEMEKAKKVGFECFTDEAYTKRYFIEVDELLKKNPGLIKEIESINFCDLSDGALKSLIVRSSEYVIELLGYYLACQPQCIAGIEDKAQEELSKIIPKNEVGEVFTLLSTPTTVTEFRKEEIDWLELLIAAKKDLRALGDAGDGKLRKSIIDHHFKYRHLHIGDGAKMRTADDFLKKFETEYETTTGKLKTRYKEVIESLGKIEKQKIETIKKFKIPRSVLKLTDTLAEIGHKRLEMRIGGWMPVQYYSYSMAQEAGMRFGYDVNLIIYATQKEIEQLFDGVMVDQTVLMDRKSSFLFHIKDGNAQLYSGSESEEKFKQLIGAIDLSGVREFKGSVAMKGSVTGTAVVLRWGDDMNEKVKLIGENFILIAGQTRPQLMPFILKSKGIVTDEGGITSHAAIVSRELKIPCVIGTKIATSVIKDGDIIEVDANKGIIKIVERK